MLLRMFSSSLLLVVAVAAMMITRGNVCGRWMQRGVPTKLIIFFVFMFVVVVLVLVLVVCVLNTGDDGCKILEVSFGNFDENDIIRLKDNYRRI